MRESWRLATAPRASETSFSPIYKAGLKPLSITVESLGTTEPDMVKNLQAFERVMWPAMSARVNDMLKTPAGTNPRR